MTNTVYSPAIGAMVCASRERSFNRFARIAAAFVNQPPSCAGNKVADLLQDMENRLEPRFRTKGPFPPVMIHTGVKWLPGLLWDWSRSGIGVISISDASLSVGNLVLAKQGDLFCLGQVCHLHKQEGYWRIGIFRGPDQELESIS